MNIVDYLIKEEKKDLRAFLEDLDRMKVIPSGEYAIEELKKDTKIENPKVDLKVLETHLKSVFLEENDTNLW